MIDASGTQLKSAETSSFCREFPVFGRTGMHSDELPVGAQRRFFNAFLQFLKAKVKSFSNTCQFRQTRSEIQCDLKKKTNNFCLKYKNTEKKY